MSNGLLILLIALGTIALVWYLAARSRRINRERRRAREAAARAYERRDPFQSDYVGGDPRKIKLGDLLDWGTGHNYTVRGTVTLKEDGYTWQEHFTDPIRGAKCYVSVEEEGDVEVVAWTDVPHFDQTPGQRQVVHDGVVYTKKESGTARFTTQGTTDLPRSGTVEYHDYEASGGRRLSFERFSGGKWEMSVGEVVTSSLTIYPAA